MTGEEVQVAVEGVVVELVAEAKAKEEAVMAWGVAVAEEVMAMEGEETVTVEDAMAAAATATVEAAMEEEAAEAAQVVDWAKGEGVQVVEVAVGSARASRSCWGSHSTSQRRCHSRRAWTAPAARAARAKRSRWRPLWASHA